MACHDSRGAVEPDCRAAGFSRLSLEASCGCVYVALCQ